MSFPTRKAFLGQRYISISQVAQKVKRKDKDYLVIDVRSSDFPGGNIPRALNITSRNFEDSSSVTSIISSQIIPRYTSSPPLELVILHCMQSQYRGPMAAQSLRRHPDWPEDLPCVVMEGGYRGWRKMFKGEEGMIEDLAAEGKKGGGGEDEFVEEQHSIEIRERQERDQKEGQ